MNLLKLFSILEDCDFCVETTGEDTFDAELEPNYTKYKPIMKKIFKFIHKTLDSNSGVVLFYSFNFAD